VALGQRAGDVMDQRLNPAGGWPVAAGY